jgi:hypothetical protein
MASRRQSAAMLSSPRRPSRTIRILSSAEWCLRVARRMSRMSQNSSASQPRRSVSRVLTSDTGRGRPGAGSTDGGEYPADRRAQPEAAVRQLPPLSNRASLIKQLSNRASLIKQLSNRASLIKQFSLLFRPSRE